MLLFDKENYYFDQGCRLVCGLDEAGRGPLAGPVVAAVVFIDREKATLLINYPEFKYIKDSKKLSAKKREELFTFIYNNFTEVGVGTCDHETIDRINILEATFLAMKKAISAVKLKPDFALLDGNFTIPNSSLKQEAIIKGDNLVPIIAAASIIAKVTRDRIMDAIHKQYPMYGFDRHKGYGTREHMEAIKKYGPCPLHRRSFKPISELF
jgi:ribonuclease HII